MLIVRNYTEHRRKASLTSTASDQSLCVGGQRTAAIQNAATCELSSQNNRIPRRKRQLDVVMVTIFSQPHHQDSKEVLASSRATWIDNKQRDCRTTEPRKCVEEHDQTQTECEWIDEVRTLDLSTVYHKLRKDTKKHELNWNSELNHEKKPNYFGLRHFASLFQLI